MTIYTESLQQLYVAYFSRPADVAGLAFWEAMLVRTEGATSDVAAAFAASAEYRAAYAGKNAAQIVDTVYTNLFGRLAETAGKQYWAELLSNGILGIDAVVTAVAAGAQGSDRVAFDSKVAAATAFTGALDTAAEIAGYSGAAAIGRAVDFLAAITTAAELAAAISKTALDEAVIAITGILPLPPPVEDPIPTPAPRLPSKPAPQVIDLGPGDDRLGDVVVAAGDSVDGGDGFDTLALAQVTALNIGAFSNFEQLEVAALGPVDLAGLGGKNTITDIVVTGGEVEGGLELLNMGTVAGVRITADQVGVVLKQDQPRALSVTVDIDETTLPSAARASFVSLDGGTELTIVMDCDFSVSRPGETGLDESLLNGCMVFGSSDGVRALNIVSGGEHAFNFLMYEQFAEDGGPLAVTISGDRPLTLFAAGASLIDASASSGGLDISTRRLADGAVIKLGSGADTIAVSNNSSPTHPESIVGLAKAASIALSAEPGDAQAAALAMAAADTVVIAGAFIADSFGGDFSGGTIERGVLTFTGLGPASLDAAFAIAALAAEGAGETVLFEYQDDSYLFANESVAMGVKLVGLTGVTALAAGATDHLFVV